MRISVIDWIISIIEHVMISISHLNPQKKAQVSLSRNQTQKIVSFMTVSITFILPSLSSLSATTKRSSKNYSYIFRGWQLALSCMETHCEAICWGKMSLYVGRYKWERKEYCVSETESQNLNLLLPVENRRHRFICSLLIYCQSVWRER